MTIKFRPDIRPDFDLKKWNLPPRDTSQEDAAKWFAEGGGSMVDQPTHVATLGEHEVRCTCPRCGSPYIATFKADEKRHGEFLPGFTCVAGDCEKAHPLQCSSQLARSEKPEDRARARRMCEEVHGPAGHARRSR